MKFSDIREIEFNTCKKQAASPGREGRRIGGDRAKRAEKVCTRRLQEGLPGKVRWTECFQRNQVVGEELGSGSNKEKTKSISRKKKYHSDSL